MCTINAGISIDIKLAKMEELLKMDKQAQN